MWAIFLSGGKNTLALAVKDAIRSARDVLMGLNRDNPDALGAYGFTVVDARKGSATPPPPAP